MKNMIYFGVLVAILHIDVLDAQAVIKVVNKSEGAAWVYLRGNGFSDFMKYVAVDEDVILPLGSIGVAAIKYNPAITVDMLSKKTYYETIPQSLLSNVSQITITITKDPDPFASKHLFLIIPKEDEYIKEQQAKAKPAIQQVLPASGLAGIVAEYWTPFKDEPARQGEQKKEACKKQ